MHSLIELNFSLEKKEEENLIRKRIEEKIIQDIDFRCNCIGYMFQRSNTNGLFNCSGYHAEEFE